MSTLNRVLSAAIIAMASFGVVSARAGESSALKSLLSDAGLAALPSVGAAIESSPALKAASRSAPATKVLWLSGTGTVGGSGTLQSANPPYVGGIVGLSGTVDLAGPHGFSSTVALVGSATVGGARTGETSSLGGSGVVTGQAEIRHPGRRFHGSYPVSETVQVSGYLIGDTAAVGGTVTIRLRIEVPDKP